jgi:hypothetical protein
LDGTLELLPEKNDCLDVACWVIMVCLLRTLLIFDPVAPANFWCNRAKIDAVAWYHINFAFDASRCNSSRCNSLVASVCCDRCKSSLLHRLFVVSCIKIERCKRVIASKSFWCMITIASAMNVYCIKIERCEKVIASKSCWCNTSNKFDAIRISIATALGSMQYKLLHRH